MSKNEEPEWTRRQGNGTGPGFDGIVRRAGDLELSEILGPDHPENGGADWTGVGTPDIATSAPPVDAPDVTPDWSHMAVETRVEPPVRPRVDIDRPRASELADPQNKPGSFLSGLMFWRATR
jgi:hypothetical protein